MKHRTTIATVLVCSVLCAVGGEVSTPSGKVITPETLANSSLDERTLSEALLSFLDVLQRGDVEAARRFFGANEDLDATEIKHYLKNNRDSYLDNCEDIYPLSLLLGKGQRTISKATKSAPEGWTAGLAMEVTYAVPRGLLSAAPMKTYVGKGTSYCVLVTADVPKVGAEYGPKKLLFGDVNPASDLGPFRQVAEVTLYCILICDRRGNAVDVQVGRGQVVCPSNFGSFCIFKFNFRTPELGEIKFYDADAQQPAGADETPPAQP